MTDADLKFDPQKHLYTLNGQVLPSVTQIISAVGLTEYDDVPKASLDVAAERGRIVHECIEWYEHGELDETSIDPELRGYFEAYRRMRTAKMLPDKATELEVPHCSPKYGYAGTIDMHFADERWIHDHKTCKPSPTHGLQLSGYWLMLHPDFNDKPEHLTCGYYTRNAEWTIKEYPYEPLAWLAILSDYGWRRKNNCIKNKWR